MQEREVTLFCEVIKRVLLEIIIVMIVIMMVIVIVLIIIMIMALGLVRTGCAFLSELRHYIKYYI